MAKTLKGPIKLFNEYLTAEQREAKKCITNNAISIVDGAAGTGKTNVAVCYALEYLAKKKENKKQRRKVVITRATVMLDKTHNNGFLPGTLEDKMQPWMKPIYDNMQQFIPDKEELMKMIEDEIIEVVPLAYLQGRTFKDSVIIVDEAENLTTEEIKMLFTRIGKGSKMVFCGDSDQCLIGSNEGFNTLCYIERLSDNVGRVTLTTNHRDPIVKEMIRLYDELNVKDKENAEGKESK